MERVLAFGCHPDDVEFSAAGTLALLAARESQREWGAYIENMKEGTARDGKRIGRPMGDLCVELPADPAG